MEKFVRYIPKLKEYTVMNPVAQATIRNKIVACDVLMKIKFGDSIMACNFKFFQRIKYQKTPCGLPNVQFNFL